MVKKLICVGVIIVMIITFIGCKDDNSITFNVGYGDKNFVISEDILPAIVRSYEELISLCNESNSPSSKEDDIDNNEVSIKKIQEYDELYFEENALILYFYSRGHNCPAKIDSVKINNETLEIYVAVPKEWAADDVPTSWKFLIEVKKADIIGITEVQAVHIGKGDAEDYK